MKRVQKEYLTLKFQLEFKTKNEFKSVKNDENSRKFPQNSNFEMKKPKKGCSICLMFFELLMEIWVWDPHFAWSKTVDLEGNAQRCSPLSFD